MSASSSGKAGVVRELLGMAAEEFAALQDQAAGHQLPMFPVPLRARGSDRARDGMQREVERRQAPGRPIGAQNLTTREFRAWLLGRGVSPLASLMRYALLPPDVLAAELGCSRIEGFREWRILQVELAPYLHAKLAFVDDEGKPVPFLQMTVAGHQVTLQSGMTPWEMREGIARDLQQKQEVSVSALPASHAAPSHGEDK